MPLLSGHTFTPNSRSYPSVTANQTGQNYWYGLVAFYPFNGNANDESGYGNNGTVNGPVLTTDRLGNSDKAYLFDGANDWIKVEDSSSININGTSSLTISAWVYSTDNSGQRMIVSKWGPGGYEDDQYIISLSSGKVHAQFGGGPADPYSTQTLETNTWYHVAVVFNYAAQKLSTYINGSLDNSIDFAFSIPNHARFIEIGSVDFS